MAANNRLEYLVINLADIQLKISRISESELFNEQDANHVYLFNYNKYQAIYPSNTNSNISIICRGNKWSHVLTNLLLRRDLIFSPIIYKVPKDSKLISQVLNIENKTAIYIIDHGLYDVNSDLYQDGFRLLNYKAYINSAPPNVSSTNLYTNYPDKLSDNHTKTLDETLDWFLNEYATILCDDRITSGRKVLLVVYDIWQSVCKKLYFTAEQSKSAIYVYRQQLLSNRHTLSIGPKQLKDILHSMLNKGYEVFPNIDFMHDVGTKEYVRHMKHFMFPETYIFPEDFDQIKQLEPKSMYAVKSGMTSSGTGVKIVNGDEIMSAISIMSRIRGRTFITDADIDLYNKTKDDCTSRIFIIQPNNDIYKRCYEYRFMVLRDKIIAVADPRKRREKECPDVESGHKLNQDIYNFIHKVIKHVSARYVNYIYMRVDIIIECSNYITKTVGYSGFFEDTEYVYPEDIDIIFSSQSLEGKIWLNEIEPLGSGHKGHDPVTLYDTGVEAQLLTFSLDKYSLFNSIVNNICYQTHRILSGLDNSDISITLLNLNWFDQLSTEGGQFTDDNNVRNINLECHGQWTWKYVEQLMIDQLRPGLGQIKTIEFYKINDHTREIINHTDTILNTLLPPRDIICGFRYQ